MKKIIERMQRHTPPFFRKVRTAGAALVGAGTVVLTSDFTMPNIVKHAAGYAVVTGMVMIAVSQTAVTEEE